ncbi:hypothetical protein IPL85_05805 [Candidatus Saccharibacteria bacterium]|nr:MAG: hypothetical protein IPL85_05805 [Candidatus Saccharibacteria bacterium]
MKVTIKLTAIFFAIFIILFSLSPMVSTFEAIPNCNESSDKYNGITDTISESGNCARQTRSIAVFPVYRTVVCEIWHQPGCAPNTLSPGWYDNLINPVNAIIILLLATVSYRLTSDIEKRPRRGAPLPGANKK